MAEGARTSCDSGFCWCSSHTPASQSVIVLHNNLTPVFYSSWTFPQLFGTLSARTLWRPVCSWVDSWLAMKTCMEASKQLWLCATNYKNWHTSGHTHPPMSSVTIRALSWILVHMWSLQYNANKTQSPITSMYQNKSWQARSGSRRSCRKPIWLIPWQAKVLPQAQRRWLY